MSFNVRHFVLFFFDRSNNSFILYHKFLRLLKSQFTFNAFIFMNQNNVFLNDQIPEALMVAHHKRLYFIHHIRVKPVDLLFLQRPFPQLFYSPQSLWVVASHKRLLDALYY